MGMRAVRRRSCPREAGSMTTPRNPDAPPIPSDVAITACRVARSLSLDGADGHVDIIARAILAERERCAKIAELYPWDVDDMPRRIAGHIRGGARPYAIRAGT